MEPAAPPADPDAPAPPEFDRLIEWFDAFCHRLVLLDASPLGRLRAVVVALQAAVEQHCTETEPVLIALAPPAPAAGARVRALRDDHERYRASIEELGALYGVVEGEDHGGHRQALGQYGRLLAESLRAHRSEERRVLGRRNGPDRGTPRAGPAGKPK